MGREKEDSCCKDSFSPKWGKRGILRGRRQTGHQGFRKWVEISWGSWGQLGMYRLPGSFAQADIVLRRAQNPLWAEIVAW